MGGLFVEGREVDGPVSGVGRPAPDAGPRAASELVVREVELLPRGVERPTAQGDHIAGPVQHLAVPRPLRTLGTNDKLASAAGAAISEAATTVPDARAASFFLIFIRMIRSLSENRLRGPRAVVLSSPPRVSES